MSNSLDHQVDTAADSSGEDSSRPAGDGVARQASIRFAGLAFDKVMGFVFALLVTKTFGPDTFGLFVFGVGLAEVLYVTARLGMERATIRAVAELKARDALDRVRGVVVASLRLAVPTALVLALGVYLANDQLAHLFGRPQLAGFLRMIALALPAVVFCDVLLFAMEGLGTQRYTTLVRFVAEPIVKTSLVVVFFILPVFAVKIDAVGMSYVIGLLLSALLAWAFYRRVVSRSGGGFVGSTRELLSVGLPFCATMVLNRVLARAEVFLIFAFVSAAATAGYAVAQRTALLPLLLAVAVDAAFRPRMVHTIIKGVGDEFRRQFLAVSRTVLMLCLPACLLLMLFPARVMLVIGGQFVETAPVVVLVAAGALVNVLVGPAGSAINMAGRTRVTLVQGVIAGIAGVGLNLILIPRLGMTGAGISYLVSVTILNALNAVSAYRLLGIVGIGRRHLGLVAAAAISAAVTLGLDRVAPDGRYAGFIVIGTCLVLSYAGALMLIGIPGEDRRMLRSALPWRLGRLLPPVSR